MYTIVVFSPTSVMWQDAKSEDDDAMLGAKNQTNLIVLCVAK